MFTLAQTLKLGIPQHLRYQRVAWTLNRLTSTSSHDASTPVTATNRVEATLKRFWKTVDLEEREGSLSITLDSRPLKTPGGKPLLLPCSKRLSATLIVTEWENQHSVLKSYALPMTSLAARVIDSMNEAGTRADVRKALLNYLDTDTVCFHQDYPDPLVRLQNKHWDPLLTWARDTFDVELLTTTSVLFSAQPKDTKKKLDQALQNLDPWQMAAMERATYTTKSFITALALIHGHITAEQAALVAQVEVASQIERWGEVEDSHDVDYYDVRRHIGSAACLLASI
ncbi:ATP12-domain-containing protein [Multifurca ochricompacta]|uniref:ATP12-domain-containing protein n=1 Tax=Multifurca ochricompacta TaxID=376703 RepID=A0AAD4MBY6_9AGAM|nr:ATP12-domain-containing protein [Multifurca ochricompacta]